MFDCGILLSKTYNLSHTERFFLALVPSLITGVVMLIVFSWQKNEDRKRWLNDAFAKEEAENWLKYRKEFYEVTEEFLSIIDLFEYRLYPKDIKETFYKRTKLSVKLYSTHLFLKPYLEKDDDFDHENLKTFIAGIRLFLSGIYNNALKKLEKESVSVSTSEYNLNYIEDDENSKIRNNLEGAE